MRSSCLCETRARLWDEGADAQIVLDREPGKQPPVLGHVRDAELDDAMRRKVTDRTAIEHHRAAAQRHQPGNDAHQCGLAGTIWADHAYRLTLRHLERHVEQSAERTVASRDGGKG